jgi:DNA-binding PadR family transcriptional regulator
MFQYLILGLLRDGRPRWAFKLAGDYEYRSGNTGYPANVARELKKLKDDGLVARESVGPGEDERRIPYVITPKGCALFDDWLASPKAIAEAFTTWVLFIDRVPAETRVRLLSRLEDELWFQLKRARGDCEEALANSGRNGDERFNPEALRWRIKQLSSHLEYVRELLGKGGE